MRRRVLSDLQNHLSNKGSAKVAILVVVLIILSLWPACDKPGLPVRERRISCSDQKLIASDISQDIPMCPDGDGQSCFTQYDMAFIIGECVAWRRRVIELEKKCQK